MGYISFWWVLTMLIYFGENTHTINTESFFVASTKRLV